MATDPVRPARPRMRLHAPPPRAPHVVVDADGGEVGALVDWREYLALLALLATLDLGPVLAPYWRRALRDCASALPTDARAG